MFTPEYRERVRERVNVKARSDGRIVAAAAVGGSAGPSDRWSDLDLSFGVAEGAPVASVLDDWTEALSAEFDAVTLFDLPFLSSIYRVFLLPGNLQVDLSFTPAPEFGAIGPRFELLFGEAVVRPSISQPATEHIFGLGVHHAVRGYVCIERGRLWQAEYWIHELRDQALALACSSRGLEIHHGRGFDQLPQDVRNSFSGSLVRDLTIDELRRSLACATAGLLREGLASTPAAKRLQPELEELYVPDGRADR